MLLGAIADDFADANVLAIVLPKGACRFGLPVIGGVKVAVRPTRMRSFTACLG